MVSIPASGSAGPSSILDMFTNLKSKKVNHENVRDIRSVRKEGGIGAAVGESRTIPRYFSCSCSHLNLENPNFFGTVYDVPK